MQIVVGDQLKINLAKWGQNKIFGDDVDKRQKQMTSDQLIKLFEEVWETKLYSAVKTASVCDPQQASKKLSKKQYDFFDLNQEHREFRLANSIHFVAQLKPSSDNDYELTQLWYIPSSDSHPKTLFINFDTVEEREKFRKLAERLNLNDENLGKELIRDFMAKFREGFLSE